MVSNPYAPPAARVADAPPAVHGLKRRRVIVMILFVIVTLGLYYPIWWFRRRPGLNRLDSPKKLALWPLILLTALFAVQFVLGLVAGGRPLAEVIGPGAASLYLLCRLAVGIVMIVQTFRAKDMIEDHATPEAEPGPLSVEAVRLSGLMTFFFSIFYLQWAINRYVVGTQAPTTIS